MAVQKIAAIALVAIIAVPIMLGYALNLTETTETGFKTTGDSVNVTPLLMNDIGYNYAHADQFILNTDIATYGSHKIIPKYEMASPAYTPFQLEQLYTVKTYNTESVSIYDFNFYYLQLDYDPGQTNVGCDFYNYVGGVEQYYGYAGGFHSLYYEKSTGSYEISVYSGGGLNFITITGTLSRIVLNGGPAEVNIGFFDADAESFTDIAGGFHFIGNRSNWWVNLPDRCKSIIFTIDLNSITDSTYSIDIDGIGGGYTLEKSTTGGVISWLLRDQSDPTRTIDLYYDQNQNKNVYQVYWDLIPVNQDSTYVYYTSHREFRYVGAWPMVVGEANYYLTFTDDTTPRASVGSPYNFDSFSFSDSSSSRSPTIRFDDAYFEAFSYPIINGMTYNPASFKTYPATTISDITKYGVSFTFGGNTYSVNSKGNITLGSRQIPVEGLVLSSERNDLGYYDNKIGNTVVSSTLYPSSITFDGKWSARVSTIAQEQFTYTKTEWNVGSFAWDGIDSNFLMVGLITCLGVFIGCGIYARKRGTGGIIPLMIVVGCAAAVFFIML